MPEQMKITIVGGGNVGTQFAVHCAAKGHQVSIYTPHFQEFQKHLTIVDEKGNMQKEGWVHSVTENAEEAFSGAECIFVTVPAFRMRYIAEKILPYVGNGVKIGLIPGSGGGECAFRSCLAKGGIVFGIQRVPSVARLVTYGRTVRATGYREQLLLAALPRKKTKECCALMEELLDMPCAKLPGYLNVTLTPSNPVIHTSRLYTLFQDYAAGKYYDRVPLFYEEWDEDSSRLLLECDGEVQQICKALPAFDLQEVKSLKRHYESNTAEELTRKIRSIEGFQGIKTPMVPKDGGYIPDLDSRYFTADFSYGLSILRQIGEFAGVATPAMTRISGWYEKIAKHRESFNYRDYGIDNPEQFQAFYAG